MAVSRLIQNSIQSGFQRYNSAWDGISAAGAMDAISFVTLNAAQSTVEFNNISQTYTHLELRWLLRSTGAVANTTVQLVMNNDTGTNYYSHYLYGNGTSALAGGQQLSYITGFDMPGANASASIFGSGVLSILEYANTNKNKVIRNLGGFDANGSGILALGSGLWNNTAAITSLRLTCANNNFAQYSTFALYGIR